MMIKSGNSITTNLVMENPTEEKNGVEITIKNIYSFNPYERALYYIVFFPNIYIDGAKNASIINNAKFKHFNNFLFTSMNTESKLLLGNVLYPCNKSLLSPEASDFISDIEATGIAIKFNVGELNITPNRESIIYSPDTVGIINERILDAKFELEELISNRICADYTDIMEYYNAITSNISYDPLTDTFHKYGYYRVNTELISSIKITYKGNNYKQFLPIIASMMMVELPNYKGVIYGDTLKYKKLSWQIRDYKLCKSPKIVILNDRARLVESAKAYLKSSYTTVSIITEVSYDDFKKHILYAIGRTYSDTPGIDDIIKAVYESIISKSTYLDLNSDSTYLNYKKRMSKKGTTVPDKEAIIYICYENDYRHKMNFKKLSQALDYLKSLKKGIILADMNMNYSNIARIAKLKNFTLVQARKDIVAEINKIHPSYLVDLYWLIKDDPLLSVCKTILKYFPQESNMYTTNEVCKLVPKEEVSEFIKILEIRRTFCECPTYKNFATKEEIPYDSYTEYLCNKLADYIEKYTKASNLVYSSGFSDSNLIAPAIMITKAFRINGDAYKKIRNNKFLKILCRK
jgi:hypothetical protein